MLQAKDDQELEDAGDFYDHMLDYIEEFPEVSLGISPAEGAEIVPDGEPRGSGAPQHVGHNPGTPAGTMRLLPDRQSVINQAVSERGARKSH